MFDPDLAIGRELASWGKAAMLETRGRSSGRRVETAVGFVDEPDGSLLVAAGSDSAHWAQNLSVDPRLRATIAGVTRSYVAEPLEDGDRNRAIGELIVKYGTPAEVLGRGPAFRLRPMEERP